MHDIVHIYCNAPKILQEPITKKMAEFEDKWQNKCVSGIPGFIEGAAYFVEKKVFPADDGGAEVVLKINEEVIGTYKTFYKNDDRAISFGVLYTIGNNAPLEKELVKVLPNE